MANRGNAPGYDRAAAPRSDPRNEARATGRAFVSGIRRYGLLIAVVALVSGVATYAITTREPVRYVSTATLLYAANDSAGAAATTALPTIIGIGSSTVVLAPVASTLKLPIAQLRAALAVSATTQTDLITIAATASSPRLASRIANRVAASLITYSADNQRRPLQAEIGSLRRQLQTLTGGTPPGSAGTIAALRTQLSQTAAALGSSTAPLVVVSPAVAPGDPAAPHPTRDGLIGLVAGVVIGFALAGLFERLGRRGRKLAETARRDAELLQLRQLETHQRETEWYERGERDAERREREAREAQQREAGRLAAEYEAARRLREREQLQRDWVASEAPPREAEAHDPAPPVAELHASPEHDEARLDASPRPSLHPLEGRRVPELREVELRDRDPGVRGAAPYRYFSLVSDPAASRPADPAADRRRRRTPARAAPDAGAVEDSQQAVRADDTHDAERAVADDPDRSGQVAAWPETTERELVLRARLREIARENPEWGHRLAWGTLLQEGWHVDRKEIRSLWRAERLQTPGHIQARHSAVGRFALYDEPSGEEDEDAPWTEMTQGRPLR